MFKEIKEKFENKTKIRVSQNWLGRAEKRTKNTPRNENYRLQLASLDRLKMG